MHVAHLAAFERDLHAIQRRAAGMQFAQRRPRRQARCDRQRVGRQNLRHLARGVAARQHHPLQRHAGQDVLRDLAQPQAQDATAFMPGLASRLALRHQRIDHLVDTRVRGPACGVQDHAALVRQMIGGARHEVFPRPRPMGVVHQMSGAHGQFDKARCHGGFDLHRRQPRCTSGNCQHPIDAAKGIESGGAPSEQARFAPPLSQCVLDARGTDDEEAIPALRFALDQAADFGEMRRC